MDYMVRRAYEDDILLYKELLDRIDSTIERINNARMKTSLQVVKDELRIEVFKIETKLAEDRGTFLRYA